MSVDFDEQITTRAFWRQWEDSRCTPVIVKRIDEARVHPDDTLERAIRDGTEQLDRYRSSLYLSAFAGGMIIGFSALAVALATTFSELLGLTGILSRIFTALVYPLGFIFCILSGAQLFTEQTATAVYPILAGRRKVPSMLRLWLIVVLGNLSF